jgi:hypothetical protein
MGPGRDKTLIATPGHRVSGTPFIQHSRLAVLWHRRVSSGARCHLLAAFVLSLHRRTPPRTAIVGLILLIQGLLFMRLGYFAPQAVSREVSSWPAWVGLIHIIGGFVILWRASSRARRQVPLSNP